MYSVIGGFWATTRGRDLQGEKDIYLDSVHLE